SNATQSNDGRPRSRSPIVPIRDHSWKSVNAFINYTSDFRKVYVENQNESPGKVNRKNFLKQAGEKWKQMSQEEKQPYIDGAKRIRKLKVVERRRKSHQQEEKEAPQLKMKRPRKATKNKSYREDDEAKPKKKKKNKDIHYKNVIIKNVSDSSSDSDDRYGSKRSDTSI
ncbi:GSCOCG00001315001-RA-CDS, partial [Cotesia congregata]